MYYNKESTKLTAISVAQQAHQVAGDLNRVHVYVLGVRVHDCIAKYKVLQPMKITWQTVGKGVVYNLEWPWIIHKIVEEI